MKLIFQFLNACSVHVLNGICTSLWINFILSIISACVKSQLVCLKFSQSKVMNFVKSILRILSHNWIAKLNKLTFNFKFRVLKSDVSQTLIDIERIVLVLGLILPLTLNKFIMKLLLLFFFKVRNTSFHESRAQNWSKLYWNTV